MTNLYQSTYTYTHNHSINQVTMGRQTRACPVHGTVPGKAPGNVCYQHTQETLWIHTIVCLLSSSQPEWGSESIVYHVQNWLTEDIILVKHCNHNTFVTILLELESLQRFILHPIVILLKLFCSVDSSLWIINTPTPSACTQSEKKASQLISLKTNFHQDRAKQRLFTCTV